MVLARFCPECKGRVCRAYVRREEKLHWFHCRTCDRFFREEDVLPGRTKMKMVIVL